MPNKELSKKLIETLKKGVEGNAEAIKILADKDVDINYHDEDGYFPLYAAIEKNNPELVNLLLKKGASIATTPEISSKLDKKKAIVLAAKLGHWECVKAFAIRKEETFNEGDYGSALIFAVKAEKLDVVEALLRMKASQDWSTNNDNSDDYAIHIAVRKNNPELVKLLLKQGADITSVNKDKLKPAVLAAQLGHWECVKVFTAKKEKTADEGDYGNALIFAAKAERIDIAEALLKAGATLGWSTNSDDDYAIHIAVRKNNPELVKLLLKQGADITSVNKDKLKPAVLAAQLGHWECVKAFTTKKERTSSEGDYGSALIFAAKAGKIDIVEALLKAGATLGWGTNNDGDYAIHIAVRENNPELVNLLLKQGADTTVVNKDKLKPIVLAAQLGHWECVKAFISRENQRSNAFDGYKEVFSYAVKAGKTAIVTATLKTNAPLNTVTLDDRDNLLHLTVNINNPYYTYLLATQRPKLIFHKNHLGLTPLDLAVQLNHNECIMAIKDPKKYIEYHQKINNALITVLKGFRESTSSLGNLPKEIFQTIIEYVKYPIYTKSATEIVNQQEGLRYIRVAKSFLDILNKLTCFTEKETEEKEFLETNLNLALDQNLSIVRKHAALKNRVRRFTQVHEESTITQLLIQHNLFQKYDVSQQPALALLPANNNNNDSDNIKTHTL